MQKERLKLVIADENSMFRKAVKDIFHQRFDDVEIMESPNAEDALSKVVRFKPELVVTEILPYGKHPFSLIRRMKKVDGDLMVVVITNRDSEEYRQKALHSGVDLFFSKSSSNLRRIVRMVETKLQEDDDGNG